MDNLLNALLITVMGMGITFGAILVLWGMMAALTAIPDKAKDAAPSQPSAAPEDDSKARAAAAAVALALAEQELSAARPLPPPPTAIVSAWQLGTRSRQMYEKGRRRK